MKCSYKTFISFSKAVVFVALFAFFVSRVITAVKKLDHKELYAHSFSTYKTKV